MGPLAASRAEGREQRKERREKKKEKTRFFCFSLSAEGVFPKDRVNLFPSRWLAVAASERKKGIFIAQLGQPTLKKPWISKGKQAFLENRSFASKDGWDRVLRPLVDVLGPLEGARGSGSTDLVATSGWGEWVHRSGLHCLDDGGFGGT